MCLQFPSPAVLVGIMLSTSKTKLVNDPNVSVADLEGIIEGFMKSRGSRNLLELLQSFEDMSWKTAPTAQFLVDYADLYRLFFRKYRNTVMSHRRLCDALVAVHGRSPCIFHKSPQLQMLSISTMIRMGASKWRETKRCDQTRAVVMGKVIQTYC